MRKIEQAMLEAIRKGTGFSQGNTTVTMPNKYGWCEVYLHGNLIAASRIGDDDGRLQTQVQRPTFRAWPTRTTVSRLRALGVDAYIRNGISMIGDWPA
jgi:hypothetical protein